MSFVTNYWRLQYFATGDYLFTLATSISQFTGVIKLLFEKQSHRIFRLELKPKKQLSGINRNPIWINKNVCIRLMLRFSFRWNEQEAIFHNNFSPFCLSSWISIRLCTKYQVPFMDRDFLAKNVVLTFHRWDVTFLDSLLSLERKKVIFAVRLSRLQWKKLIDVRIRCKSKLRRKKSTNFLVATCANVLPHRLTFFLSFGAWNIYFVLRWH